MEGAVILLPISPPNNGFTKSHLRELNLNGHDQWYNPKESILNEDVWKSDYKLGLHQSPPPPHAPPATLAVSLPTTLPPAPPSTSSMIPVSVPAAPPGVITTAIDTSVPPPPLMSPPSIPPPQQTHVHGEQLMNLKNSMKEQARVEHGSSPPVTSTSSNAVINLKYEKDKENQLAAPDLESMDEIWHGEFSKVFAPYLPHIWYLSPTDMCPSPRWRRFKDSAKVRFCCQTCGHGWTSMKGRVVFWYFLHLPFCEGYVQFKLYGQQCMRCNNGIFEPAMWYPEEVNKVLCNLYNRIGQTYYGFVKPPIRYDRRAGKPRTQHNATLCQACRDGECDSRPRTGPATPGPPHGVLTPTPTKIPPPTVAART